MGIRTGRQYLDKLNAMTPHVVIDGEVVSEKIAEHPAFRNVARSYAKLFDMQHDPQYQEALTYTSPTTGDLVNASFLVPKTVEDLQRRRRAISTWAESSNGFLGRSGDYMNSSLTALGTAGKWFAQADPKFGENIRNYYEWARENDVLATHTLIPPQVNRSVSGSEQLGGQLSARIVEEREDGIVIQRRPHARHHRPDRGRAPRLPLHGAARHPGGRARTRTPSPSPTTPRACATCAAPRCTTAAAPTTSRWPPATRKWTPSRSLTTSSCPTSASSCSATRSCATASTPKPAPARS